MEWRLRLPTLYSRDKDDVLEESAFWLRENINNKIGHLFRLDRAAKVPRFMSHEEETSSAASRGYDSRLMARLLSYVRPHLGMAVAAVAILLWVDCQ